MFPFRSTGPGARFWGASAGRAGLCAPYAASCRRWSSCTASFCPVQTGGRSDFPVELSTDPKAFRSGRDFSAWIGLVPKQNSSGGKERLGNISKRGDRYLRSLFTTGALAVIRYAKIHGTKHRPWLTALLARRPTKVAAIALANKIARMAWAMMAKGERYKEPAALPA